MASESFSCCLCRRKLLNASALKKRKLIHGESCTRSTEFLNELMLQSFGLSVASFKETADAGAFFCHMCDGQVTRIFKLQDDIKKIEADIEEKISKLTVIDTGTTAVSEGKGHQLAIILLVKELV